MKADEPYIGSPGSVLRKAFQQISNSGPLFLTLGDVEDGGASVEVTFNAADFYDEVIGAITEEIGHEWEVTHDRILNYRKRIGTDRSNSVKLVEGRAITVGSSYTDDLFTVSNSVRAIGFGRIKKKSKSGKRITAEFNIGPIVVRNNESVGDYGILEVAKDYGYVGTEAELRRRAEAEVLTSHDPTATATFNLADVDGAFASFREGDTVTVELGLAGIRAEVRVMARSLDVATGQMTISGLGQRI
jgi:hypothetical protein